MGGESVLWAKTPDDERAEDGVREEDAGVDQSFAARRLRRWLRGVFGGKPAPNAEPREREPEA